MSERTTDVSDSVPRTSWLSDRLVGVDVARAIAILGMFVLHTLPPGAAPLLDVLAGGGRPQVLFALLDGVALALMTGAAAPPTDRSRRSLLRQQIAARGVFLIALGLFLSTMGTGIVVILDAYGVYFFLVLPVLFLRTRFLVLAAAPLLILGPWIASLVSDAVGFAQIPVAQQLLAWLFTGTYPAVVYLGYVLVGILLVRGGLLRGRRAVVASVVAALAAAAVYTSLAASRDDLAWPVLMTLESLAAAALNVALVVALTVCCDGSRSPRVRVAQILHPLRVIGAMPITIYVLHVVFVAVIATTMFGQSSMVPDTRSTASFLVLTAVSIGFAVVWSRFAGRGPLERLSRALGPRRARPAGEPEAGEGTPVDACTRTNQHPLLRSDQDRTKDIR